MREQLFREFVDFPNNEPFPIVMQNFSEVNYCTAKQSNAISVAQSFVQCGWL